MTTRIYGTLLDPMGEPLPNSDIRLTAITTSGEITKGADAVHTADGSGNYDFDIELGTFLLEINYDDEYHSAGLVLIDAFTPNGSLQELLLYSTPQNPPLIIEADPVWETLYASVLENDLLDRSGETLVSFGDIVTSEHQSVYASDTSELAKETTTVSTGNAEVAIQPMAYEDENTNQSATQTIELSTSGMVGYDSVEVYKASNGKESAKKLVTFTGTKASSSVGLHIEDSIITEGTSITFSDATVTKSVKIEDGYVDGEGQSNEGMRTKTSNAIGLNPLGHNANVSDSQEVKYVNAEELVEALLERNVKVYNHEAFQRLEVTTAGSKQVTQVDEYVIQSTDGFPIASFDTKDHRIVFDAKVQIQNTEDFKGEDGWSYDYEYEYSKDNGTSDPWHPIYDEEHLDAFRRERRFRFKDEDPEGTKEYVSGWVVHQLNAKDGANGDKYYLDYQYSTDDASYALNQWHDDYVDGDDWRRWRSVTIDDGGIYTYGDWFPERMKGLNGSNGYIVEPQYQYSIDGFDPWHYNFLTNDHYRRERTAYFYTLEDQMANDPFQVTPWTSASKIVPEDGVDYGYKNATLMIYQRATSKPAKPTGDITYDFKTLAYSGALGAWSEVIPAGTAPVWVGVASAYSLTDTDVIPNTEWVIEQMSAAGEDGNDGYNTAFVPLYQLKQTRPATPTTDITYSFFSGTLTGSLGLWQAEPPSSLDAGARVWVTFNNAVSRNSTDVLSPSNWSLPAIWTQNGQDGKDGEIGEDGKHGQGSFRKYRTTVPSDNATKDADVAAIANRPAQEGDLLNYYKDDGTAETQYSRFFFRDANGWTEANWVVDGNAVIDGTLAAQKLQAYAINGDYINARSRLLIGGSNVDGSDANAGINGEDSSIYAGWRIWSGSGTPSLANFRVDQAGKCYAEDLVANDTVSIGGTSGSRLHISKDVLEVYDGSTLRVKLGKLS